MSDKCPTMLTGKPCSCRCHANKKKLCFDCGLGVQSEGEPKTDYLEKQDSSLTDNTNSGELTPDKGEELDILLKEIVCKCEFRDPQCLYEAKQAIQNLITREREEAYNHGYAVKAMIADMDSIEAYKKGAREALESLSAEAVTRNEEVYNIIVKRLKALSDEQ